MLTFCHSASLRASDPMPFALQWFSHGAGNGAQTAYGERIRPAA